MVVREQESDRSICIIKSYLRIRCEQQKKESKMHYF